MGVCVFWWRKKANQVQLKPVAEMMQK